MIMDEIIEINVYSYGKVRWVRIFRDLNINLFYYINLMSKRLKYNIVVYIIFERFVKYKMKKDWLLCYFLLESI